MLNNLISLYNGGAAAAATSYESIATVTVGAGGSSSITFSSIPSTYKHLQLRIIAHENSGVGTAYNSILGRFNSDSGANYTYHYLRGNGSTASAGSATSQTSAWIGSITEGGVNASTFMASVVDILDYSNTNKYKTVRQLDGYDANGSGYTDLISSLWQSTSAISSIVLTPGNGFAQYSQAALYGVKG